MKFPIRTTWLAIPLFFCVYVLLPSFAYAEREFTLSPVDIFIFKWKKSGGSELGASQLFISELCDVLYLARPDSPRPDIEDNTYIFEKSVIRISPSGRKTIGRIDCYKKGHFIWESKQGSDKPDATSEGARRKGSFIRGTQSEVKALFNARIQAVDYARSLPANEQYPPFVIIADIPNIEIYADFHATGDYSPYPTANDNRITIDDIRRPEIQDRLYRIFTNPLSLDPSRENEKVTRNIALQLSILTKLLDESGYDTDIITQFLIRCIFTMYAEDCGLLKYHTFSKIIETSKNNPTLFVTLVHDLWEHMKNDGDTDYAGKILKFQGYFFSDVNVIPLNEEQLSILSEAAKANWSSVDTSIFGALLEQALTPLERRKLGTYYTPSSYAERLVIPTIIESEREQWDSVTEQAIEYVSLNEPEKAIECITEFHKHLSEIRVLDPACGSGNFLSVSMSQLKLLESEVIHALRVLGLSERDIQRQGISVKPEQFKGIESVPRAAAVAELVLWITYFQEHYKIHGKVNPPEPILYENVSIECRDAVLAWDSIKTTQAQNGTISFEYINPRPADAWPECDYIVGNPPFSGKSKIRKQLGNGYVDALRIAYPELPKNIDYVMYWWVRAAKLVQSEKVKRFGFITTKAIKESFNRKLVEKFVNKTEKGLNILFAIPNHPWYSARNGGANVRIAMMVCSLEQKLGILAEVILEHDDENFIKVNLKTKRGIINSNLTLHLDISSLKSLKANSMICSIGMTIAGKGFLIPQETAYKLGIGHIEDLKKHIRPFLTGKDLMQHSRNMLIIDLYGLALDEVKNRYPLVYEWIVDKVKPEREAQKRTSYKDWWTFSSPCPGLRKSIQSLNRFIVMSRVSKHGIFSFIDSNIIPDTSLVCIASDSSYILGILSSKIHKQWVIAVGGKHGVGNSLNYKIGLCFNSFPFPQTTQKQKEKISYLAEQLYEHRKKFMELHPALTLTGIYNVMEKLYYGVSLKPQEKRISQQADVPALLLLHTELDKAVSKAYGWPESLSPEETVTRLIRLNKIRHEEEARGLVRWLRPEYQVPRDPAVDVLDGNAPYWRHYFPGRSSSAGIRISAIAQLRPPFLPGRVHPLPLSSHSATPGR